VKPVPLPSSASSVWSPAPLRLPCLDAACVHVWRIALVVSDAEQDERVAALAPNERARASGFHFERDRRRWTAARGAVRAVLASYAGVPAASLIFRVGPHGKPALDGPAARAALDFNVSHSGDLALCAVTRARAVGVDVEAVRPEFATDEVARRFFAPGEVAALEALPPDERVEAFFACWTRKEAYIKARGSGIALGLDRFEVALAPGRPAALLATQDEPAAAARWQLVALAPGEGYAGALATDGPARLACWQWPPGDARAIS
jgi:4'-phosphopantetheinyl transferase